MWHLLIHLSQILFCGTCGSSTYSASRFIEVDPRNGQYEEHYEQAARHDKRGLVVKQRIGKKRRVSKGYRIGMGKEEDLKHET